MTKAELIQSALSYFEGECGHRWVGASSGSYACPVCGLHDGDYHLTCMEEIPVQIDDIGTAWEDLLNESRKAYPKIDAEGETIQ
jgi:hypothetical protein